MSIKGAIMWSRVSLAFAILSAVLFLLSLIGSAYKKEAKEDTLGTITIDGCEYLTGGGLLAHKGDCMNPIHWGHVIRDTSWYWKVRASEMDSNSAIHTQK